MHELSLSSAIVETVERHADGRRVTVVTMRIGALRQVVPDSLAFYFEIVVARDGLRWGPSGPRAVSALLRCPDCAHEWDPAPSPVASHGGPFDAIPALPCFRCPECGSGGAEVLGGGEFEVESIEVETSETKEERCTAPR